MENLHFLRYTHTYGYYIIRLSPHVEWMLKTQYWRCNEINLTSRINYTNSTDRRPFECSNQELSLWCEALHNRNIVYYCIIVNRRNELWAIENKSLMVWPKKAECNNRFQGYRYISKQKLLKMLQFQFLYWYFTHEILHILFLGWILFVFFTFQKISLIQFLHKKEIWVLIMWISWNGINQMLEIKIKTNFTLFCNDWTTTK